MRRRVLITAIALAALCACGEKKPEARRLPMQGVVKALDPTAKVASIDAGKIGDWMEAMKMEYLIKPDAEFAKLHVGDKIEATVVVNDLKYYVTDIKVTPPQ